MLIFVQVFIFHADLQAFPEFLDTCVSILA